MGSYFYACMWFCLYNYDAPLGGPSDARSSAKNAFHCLCFLTFVIIQTQNQRANNVNRKPHRKLV